MKLTLKAVSTSFGPDGKPVLNQPNAGSLESPLRGFVRANGNINSAGANFFIDHENSGPFPAGFNQSWSYGEGKIGLKPWEWTAPLYDAAVASVTLPNGLTAPVAREIVCTVYWGDWSPSTPDKGGFIRESIWLYADKPYVEGSAPVPVPDPPEPPKEEEVPEPIEVPQGFRYVSTLVETKEDTVLGIKFDTGVAMNTGPNNAQVRVRWYLAGKMIKEEGFSLAAYSTVRKMTKGDFKIDADLVEIFSTAAISSSAMLVTTSANGVQYFSFPFVRI